MNYFVVMFERNSLRDYRDFHADFVKHSGIVSYWHWITSSYIVQTEWSLEELSDHFTKCADKNKIPPAYVVLNVDLAKGQGIMPEDAWDWINDHAVKQKRYP